MHIKYSAEYPARYQYPKTEWILRKSPDSTAGKIQCFNNFQHYYIKLYHNAMFSF